MTQLHHRARQLISSLGLIRHPEGGYYREIFRSQLQVSRSSDDVQRSNLTSIYYLLPQGEHSAWHSVCAADEVWHWCEGGTLELFIADPGIVEVHSVMLGELEAEPQAGRTEPVRIVPSGCWQAARTCGAYTLLSCDVGPGFDFADFKLLRDHSELVDSLRKLHAVHAEML